MVIQKIKKAVGQIKVPGDKSISHRAVMLGSLANGVTEISGFLKGADCLSTIDCFRKMGIDIDINGENVTVHADKAIDALDEAGSRVHISNIIVPKSIEELEAKIEDTKNEKLAAVKSQNFELAASFRDKERQYLLQLEAAKAKPADLFLQDLQRLWKEPLHPAPD